MEWERNVNPERGPPAEEVSEPVRAELFRQRRQLLWLTFALVIYYCAGVQLGHEADAQGVKLSITRPEFLVWAVWCAWGWSLWRYWQYERTHPDKNYRSWREHQLLVAAIRLGQRKAYTECVSARPSDLPHDSIVELSSDRDIEIGRTLDGGLQIKNYGVTHQTPDGSRAVSRTTRVNLSGKEFRYAQRQGRWNFWFGRPFALDYKAPYFLALLAPAAKLWTWIS
jgi:hypothetical protein